MVLKVKEDCFHIKDNYSKETSTIGKEYYQKELWQKDKYVAPVNEKVV